MARTRSPRSESRSIRGLFAIIGGAAALGVALLAAAFFIYLNSRQPQPSVAAPIPTFTPVGYVEPTQRPLATATPTVTPLPPEEDAAPAEQAADAPTPTPEPTPTALPTPDGRERELVVPVLMYHYVSTPPEDADIYRLDLSTPPEAFRQQMQWLADNGYETITPYDLVYALQRGKPLPERPVLLTFDDGYIDNYEHAYPILEEFGFTGTFFILTDVTDRAQPGYMTWDMLREMVDAGHSVEVHGREHLDMANRDDGWLYFHMIGAAETIEATLGYRPRILSYPAGSYDALVLEKMAEYDYWLGFTTVNGSAHTNDALYELKRVRIRGDWPLATYGSVVEAASY